jgi:AAA domain
MSSPLELIVRTLPHAKPVGAGWRAPCPAHGGDNPTAVSLSEGEDGAALLYCHSHGCTAGDIMRAIGLQERDLFPEGHPGRKGQRPKAGWSWKPKQKDRLTIDTERLAVDFATLAILKLLHPLPDKPPQADDATEAIAPYNAVIEDLWAAFSARQSHEDVLASWTRMLSELQWSAPNLVAAVQRRFKSFMREVTRDAGDKTPLLRGKKASDLLKMTFPEAKAIIPGVLYEGLTMLVGKPKVGKSRLLLAWAVAIATGGKVLGEIQVEAGDVLYISLEDHERRLQKRIRELLGDRPCPETLEYERQWRPVDEGGLEDIELWIQRHPRAKLIVIDTFKRVRSRKRRNGSVYDEDYEDLQGLQDLCNRHSGLAMVVNHHENKMGDVADWMDRASGSTGLIGGVDGAASLRRQRGSVDAVLTIAHRDIDTEEGEFKYALKSDHETGGWTLMGEAESYQLSQERQAVLECLKGAPGPMTPKAIAHALGRSSEGALNALYKLLHQMLMAEQILSPARGYYVYSPLGKDGKDGKGGKDGKDGKESERIEILTDLTGPSESCKDAGKDGSAEYHNQKPPETENLTDLTASSQPEPDCEHGMQAFFWEAGKLRCGVCMGLPPERIEIMRRRARDHA